MAGTYARGAQTMNSMFIKPMLRKNYHRKSSSSDVKSDNIKLNDEEGKRSSYGGSCSDSNWWIPHHQTGIYYPKGREKVIEDIPHGAGKDMGTNWFS